MAPPEFGMNSPEGRVTFLGDSFLLQKNVTKIPIRVASATGPRSLPRLHGHVVSQAALLSLLQALLSSQSDL